MHEIEELFGRAINGPMSTNFLLNFAYADFEESRHQKDRAEEVYKTLLDNPDLDPTLASIIISMGFRTRSSSNNSMGFRPEVVVIISMGFRPRSSSNN